MRTLFLVVTLSFCAQARLVADEDVYLTGVPDYEWQYGCFGTACGNLMGYWDRHGFPDFYKGPTSGGMAPLSSGTASTSGIRSMWASQAGIDGRPAGVFGHVDDYYDGFESTATDRYIRSNRTEHVSDCIGDFIGLNQKRWTNMNGECDGNVDGFSFVYWETNGVRRINFTPPPQGTNTGKDIPSGLRTWTRSRGGEADVFSQLVEFNPKCPSGAGFTFADLKAEIDAGYPVLAFLQGYANNSRSLSGMAKANPAIHAMLIYGYATYDGYGTNVYVRDSWAGGLESRNWSAISWVSGNNYPVRGIIGYRPKPRVRSMVINGANLTLAWDGPSSQLYDNLSGQTKHLHLYQVEKSIFMHPADFQSVGPTTTNRTLTLPYSGGEGYYRVQLLP